MKLVAETRPRTVDGIRGQAKIKEIVKRWIARGDMPDMILVGPAGCGKTSLVYATVSEFFHGFDIWNHEHPDFLELNASDARGIDVIRDVVKDWASVEKPMDPTVPFRIVFFDEARAQGGQGGLTHEAQTALRNTVEKFEDRCRFIYSGNDDDYIEAILSRAAELHFTVVPDEEAEPFIINVAAQHGITFSGPEVIKTILGFYHGDLRKVQNDCLEKLIGIDHPVTSADLDFSDTPMAVIMSILGVLNGQETPRERYFEARKVFEKEHARLQFDTRDFLAKLHETIGPMAFDAAKAFSEADDRIRSGGTKDVHVGYVLKVLADATANSG